VSSFLTWGLDGDEWSTAGSGSYNPCQKPQCPLNMRIFGYQTRS